MGETVERREFDGVPGRYQDIRVSECDSLGDINGDSSRIGGESCDNSLESSSTSAEPHSTSPQEQITSPGSDWQVGSETNSDWSRESELQQQGLKDGIRGAGARGSRAQQNGMVCAFGAPPGSITPPRAHARPPLPSRGNGDVGSSSGRTRASGYHSARKPPVPRVSSTGSLKSMQPPNSSRTVQNSNWPRREDGEEELEEDDEEEEEEGNGLEIDEEGLALALREDPDDEDALNEDAYSEAENDDDMTSPIAPLEEIENDFEDDDDDDEGAYIGDGRGGESATVARQISDVRERLAARRSCHLARGGREMDADAISDEDEDEESWERPLSRPPSRIPSLIARSSSSDDARSLRKQHSEPKRDLNHIPAPFCTAPDPCSLPADSQPGGGEASTPGRRLLSALSHKGVVGAAKKALEAVSSPRRSHTSLFASVSAECASAREDGAEGASAGSSAGGGGGRGGGGGAEPLIGSPRFFSSSSRPSSLRPSASHDSYTSSPSSRLSSSPSRSIVPRSSSLEVPRSAGVPRSVSQESGFGTSSSSRESGGASRRHSLLAPSSYREDGGSYREGSSFRGGGGGDVSGGVQGGKQQLSGLQAPGVSSSVGGCAVECRAVGMEGRREDAGSALTPKGRWGAWAEDEKSGDMDWFW
ncbi:unnamed protein product [Closterium sp. NIES-65]|nr:unnamed protein product [Closterium sp. NIES-65]